MSAKMSLSNLVFLATSPNAGVLTNFSALNKVLNEIVGHLQIGDLTTDWRCEDLGKVLLQCNMDVVSKEARKSADSPDSSDEDTITPSNAHADAEVSIVTPGTGRVDQHEHADPQTPLPVKALKQMGQPVEGQDTYQGLADLLEANNANKAKLDELEKRVQDIEALDQAGGRHQDSEDQLESLTAQIPCIWSSVQKLTDDMLSVKEDENLVKAEQDKLKMNNRLLQEQLDYLEGALQTFKQQQVEQSQSSRPAAQEDESTLLFQRCEKLQDLVTIIIKQQEAAKTTVEESQLMNNIQDAIKQLQINCENLQLKNQQLLEGQSKNTDEIQHLSKSIKELDKKKADKELVEMEIKSDKHALDTKVSHKELDTATEQLHILFQELLSKVLGQEQDWKTVVEKISTEMECKLNRIELVPLKNQLEERWNTISEQLHAQPALKDVDPAGIKRQLVTKFFCISCDRPVDLPTLGPHASSMQHAPGQPTKKSIKPYIKFDMAQLHQHCRSFSPGTKQNHYEGTVNQRQKTQNPKSVESLLSCPKQPFGLRVTGSLPPILAPLKKTS